METIWFTGSPANRNIEKAINPTANKTPSAWKARRTMNASINGSHKSCRAVTETAAVVQMIPDADGRVRPVLVVADQMGAGRGAAGTAREGGPPVAVAGHRALAGAQRVALTGQHPVTEAAREVEEAVRVGEQSAVV